jgi:hypothetical protein
VKKLSLLYDIWGSHDTDCTDVTPHSLVDRSWERKMEVAHSSVTLLPKYQTTWYSIPENSNPHTLFSIIEGYVSGQKNQLILQILNAHLIDFMKHLILNFSFTYCPTGSLGSSVNILIRLQAGWPRILVQFPVGTRDLCVFQSSVNIHSGAHPVSCSWVLGILLQGSKAVLEWTNHSPPFNTENMND